MPSAEVALQRALAVFRPQLAEPRFRAAPVDPRGGTALLRNLAASYRQLPPADRRLAEAILARPTDGGFDFNIQLDNYTAPKSDFRHKCYTNFCIHWVKSTRDAPSLRDRSPKNHLPDWIDKTRSVMNVVWQKEVLDFGYGPPKKDGNSGSHRGGNPNSKIDIFIQDVGRAGLYGYCTTDDTRFEFQNNLSAYCVFDDDFSKKQFAGAATGLAALKVTAAHEFNHAIQFNYDFFEDPWFLEATATNMEADVYPAIHDNYQYFSSSPLSKTNPHLPIDRWANDGTQYGSWIFFRFLAEYFSSPGVHPAPTVPNPAFVHEIWVHAKATPGTTEGGEYSTEAIEAFLDDHSETFPSVFRQFGVANAAPAAWYKDGAQFNTRAAQGYTKNPLDAGFSYPADTGMTHMSNNYWIVSPGTGATTLDIDADFPSDLTSPRATVLTFPTGGGIVEQEIALDSNGIGSLPSPITFDGTVNKVVIVVTNASTRFTQCNTDFQTPPFFSCAGKPQDDFRARVYKLDLLVP
ncbi:MAG TPA: MXAN_6640 family putative metalloprotease [Candidatus Eisenbacteria bacterium]|nr:MXAN_6640 family putative metalloprotease [Candidatus Eisenbacteria bacterium]